MTHTLVFDYADSLRRMGGDAHLLCEMIGFLRTDSPHRLAELRASLADNDCAIAARAAHSLKGFALNFAAPRAIRAAAALEKCAGLSSNERQSAVVELAAALEELLAALAPVADRVRSIPNASCVSDVSPPAVTAGAVPPP